MHHFMELGYHGLLVDHPSILQAERHDIVGVSSPVSDEHCFGFVLFSHLYLIITREPFHTREEHVGRSVIN